MNPHGVSVPEHLEELRKHVIVVLISLAIFTTFAFFFSHPLLDFITFPIKRSVNTLYFITPYEAFMTSLKVSFAAGLIVSLPVIFWQIYQFVVPALYFNERKMILPLVLFSVALFLTGAAFAYFFVIPFALDFFLGFSTDTVRPMISIGSYISFWLTIILTFGFTFDVPIVIIGLIYLGVLKTEMLRKQRRMIVLIAFVVAAVITPTVDLVTQTCLAIALWVLFELSMVAGSMIEKNRTGKNISV